MKLTHILRFSVVLPIVFYGLNSLPLWGKEAPTKEITELRRTADHRLDQGESGKAEEFALPGGGKLVMKFCPGGTFTIGSPKEEPGRGENERQQEVTLGSHYWMAETECTQAQWEALMGPLGRNREHKGEDRPVICEEWGQAQQYVAKLNEQLATPTGWKWSLPSEAQWEGACRTGTTTRFHYGDDPDGAQLKDHAWYADNSGGTIHPVARMKPNARGLYDMHGNVREWCLDWTGDRAGDKAKDSSGEEPSSEPLLRGGDFRDHADGCRSARRSICENGGSPDAGFRVVLTRGQIVARTETKTSTKEFDIPAEVVAFVEKLIESDPDLRARYAQLIAPVKEEAGGKFNTGPFVPIEWLVPEFSISRDEHSNSEGSYVYLVKQQLVFGFSRGYSVPDNVIAQVTATETDSYDPDPSNGGDRILAASTLSLHFDGFVDIQIRPDKATSQKDAVSAVEALGARVTFAPAFTVDFSGTELGDGGLEKLQWLADPQVLNLSGTAVTDAGLRHLEGMKNLESLNLCDTKLTDVGLAHLKGMTHLQEMSLENLPITDAGLEHLKGLSKLRSLILYGTEVTGAGIEKLQTALPDCNIIH